MSSSLEDNETAPYFDCICRCCLTDKTKLKPIFNQVGYITEAIFLITAVEFLKDDGFPQNICIDCLHQLDMCIQFKRQVENSAVFLQNSLTDLAQKIIVEDEDSSLSDQDHSSSNQAKIPSTSNESAPFICTFCGRYYTSRCAYNRHRKLHTPIETVFRCNECGKKFNHKINFANHQMCHTKQISYSKPNFPCLVCKNIFATEQDLFIHGSLHEVEIKCKACGKEFKNYVKLKRHIPQHFIYKPFKCSKCDKSFSEMASLTRHYPTHSKLKPKSMYSCIVCDKGFRNKYELKVHNRIHTGERPWKCTSCEKRFTDFRLLNSHKKLHEEIKQHICQQCHKSFRHRSTLVTHKRTHAGSRPFRCNKCKKSYRQLWSLRIHQRSHNITERFLCNKCNQVFSKATSLTDHLQWHSDQDASNDQQDKTNTKEPLEFFQCKECYSHFPSRLDLITHEKLTHAQSHECGTCFGNWKTLEELIQHKCEEALQTSVEPTPDEMILLPNGEVQDCNTVVDALLASISQKTPTTEQS